jgi:hypothetical protein
VVSSTVKPAHNRTSRLLKPAAYSLPLPSRILLLKRWLRDTTDKSSAIRAAPYNRNFVIEPGDTFFTSKTLLFHLKKVLLVIVDVGQWI